VDDLSAVLAKRSLTSSVVTGGNSSSLKLTGTCDNGASDASCDARVAARSLIFETLAMK